jgi:myosin heavy subunit
MADTMRIPPLNSFEDVGAILREICEKQEKTSGSLTETDHRVKEHDEWRKERETRAKEHDEWRKRMEKLAEEHAKLMKEHTESMKENDEQMKKHTGEIEEIRAILKEADRITKETAESMKDTDRRMKENARQMGFVQNKLGEVVEHIVMPNISEKFKHFGYAFGPPQRNVKFYDKNHSLIAEADILMLGDAGFMIGEVKTTLKKEDVDRHVKRLETIRNNAAWPQIDGGRKLWGFMAGAIADEDVKEYARQSGLFVAAQTGDTIKLDVPDGFVPKTW